MNLGEAIGDGEHRSVVLSHVDQGARPCVPGARRLIEAITGEAPEAVTLTGAGTVCTPRWW